MCQSILSMEVKIHEMNTQAYRNRFRNAVFGLHRQSERTKTATASVVCNLFPTIRVKMRFFWVEQRTKFKKMKKQILTWQLKSQNRLRAGYNNDRSNKTRVSEGKREQKKVSDKHIQGKTTYRDQEPELRQC